MDKNTISDNVISVSRAFKKMLVDENVPISSVIIFGSQVKGKSRADSDIDLCVVSPIFGKNNLTEMQMLFRKARKIDSRIEPYPLSPSELSHAENPIVGEIVKWGVVV